MAHGSIMLWPMLPGTGTKGVGFAIGGFAACHAEATKLVWGRLPCSKHCHTNQTLRPALTQGSDMHLNRRASPIIFTRPGWLKSVVGRPESFCVSVSTAVESAGAAPAAASSCLGSPLSWPADWAGASPAAIFASTCPTVTVSSSFTWQVHTHSVAYAYVSPFAPCSFYLII